MNLQLLNTVDTIARIVALIRDAKERVMLVSAYSNLGTDDRLGREIRDALSRRVRVTMIVREDDRTPLKAAWLEALRPQLEAGLVLKSVAGLHAKVYLSDSAVLISSLNLLSASFLKTIEVGLWSDEPGVIREVDAFLKREVVPHAQPVALGGRPQLGAAPASSPRPVARPASPKGKLLRKGRCIRCADPVPLNPDRPYCPDCFDEWAEWENEDYQDEFCHGCGDGYPATMAQPLCRDCFKSVA